MGALGRKRGKRVQAAVWDEDGGNESIHDDSAGLSSKQRHAAQFCDGKMPNYEGKANLVLHKPDFF
jgi:hypothetical protein